jgi:AraC-like DNA-binding protein
VWQKCQRWFNFCQCGSSSPRSPARRPWDLAGAGRGLRERRTRRAGCLRGDRRVDFGRAARDHRGLPGRDAQARGRGPRAGGHGHRRGRRRSGLALGRRGPRATRVGAPCRRVWACGIGVLGGVRARGRGGCSMVSAWLRTGRRATRSRPIFQRYRSTVTRSTCASGTCGRRPGSRAASTWPSRWSSAISGGVSPTRSPRGSCSTRAAPGTNRSSRTRWSLRRAPRIRSPRRFAWARSHLREVTVEELARRAGLSVRTLHRRCLELTSATPAKLVERLRVERGRDLLARGKSVKTMATSVGFESPARARRAFERVLGLSPREAALLFGRR